MIPLSWSRVSVYRQCPNQFEAKYITKEYPDESDNPAFEKGNQIHSQLENYINWKKGKGTKPDLCVAAANAVPIIESYFKTTVKDAISAEKQIALNHDWKLCGWFDNTKIVTWRGILDMLVAITILVKPLKPVLIWAIFWAFATALIRPLSGEHILAFVERSANWVLPFALCFSI